MAGGPGDHERQVDDDIGTGERLTQRVLVAHVALPVLELRPAVLGRIERAASDPDDPLDPGVGLE